MCQCEGIVLIVSRQKAFGVQNHRLPISNCRCGTMSTTATMPVMMMTRNQVHHILFRVMGYSAEYSAAGSIVSNEKWHFICVNVCSFLWFVLTKRKTPMEEKQTRWGTIRTTKCFDSIYIFFFSFWRDNELHWMYRDLREMFGIVFGSLDVSLQPNERKHLFSASWFFRLWLRLACAAKNENNNKQHKKVK